MNQQLLKVLKEKFGFDSFRPLQANIIEEAMNGNDVLAIMPTGGGKSLCYQIPGLLRSGICLVVTPLIALMNDQVQNLRRKNITAFAIHTGMPRKEVVHVLKTAVHSNCKFLYVSPERLETNLFKEYLPALSINFIAVDEAHCISQWGYDFRPSYLRIVQLREELTDVPVIALTASATPRVQEDICEKLSIEAPHHFKIFRQSFARPNLSYSVIKAQSRFPKITELLQNSSGSAIIYCKTRRQTKEINDLLHLQGFSSDYYNAGLTTAERSKKQQDWMRQHTRVIVCTNAFGMGIDKANVRLVIHADIPDCLENYYQEAGRAGRDGKPAAAVLLYMAAGLELLKQLPAIRYPSLDIIKAVYEMVVNYLQLPEGEFPGEYYDFDLKDFTRKFGVDINTTIYCLKALEQDGWLSFNEQIFVPATVRFTIYKEALYEYEKKHSSYEPIIKMLLRTYEGIYDYPVAVSETYLAYLMKIESVVVKEQLFNLHINGIIAYQPQKDQPQLMLTRARVKASLLKLNIKNYEERKKLFTDRVMKMQGYLANEKECRSKIIGNYFGDETIPDCNICDNCLKNNPPRFTKEIFSQIQSAIKEILQEATTASVIIKQLQNFDRQHILKVIRFLTDEGKIVMLKSTQLKWK